VTDSSAAAPARLRGNRAASPPASPLALPPASRLASQERQRKTRPPGPGKTQASGESDLAPNGPDSWDKP
jgi:hypothetical protein